MRFKCRNCLIPAAVKDVNISSDNGLCNRCRESASSAETPAQREKERNWRVADLERALSDSRGRAEYDCLVPFSGGKDSVYLLHKLKHDYGLNILAFTVNSNIPDLAWESIKRTLKKLDIDHISYSPKGEFYRKLFRYLLQNQEERGAVYSISYVYAPLFEGDAIKLALEKNIPLVLAGYSPGQPEPERMLYEFSPRLISSIDWTPPELRSCGKFSEEELNRFYNPTHLPKGTNFPRYLAPFHAWEYDQDHVMRAVVDLGLVPSKKHASPVHSNYPINWLLMYSDLKAFGYNPYEPEFADLIREGKASRSYWRIMVPLVNFMLRHRLGGGREVTRSLKWLDLQEEDLCINKPLGAYDPATT
jgi:hypothetical protein